MFETFASALALSSAVMSSSCSLLSFGMWLMGIEMLHEGDDDVDDDVDDVDTDEAEGWGGVSCCVTTNCSFCFFLFLRSKGFRVSRRFSSHTPTQMEKENKIQVFYYFLKTIMGTESVRLTQF